MAQNELPGGRTDFLQVLYRDWTLANGYPETADLTDATTNAGSERINLYWDELTGAPLAARRSDTWSSLTYFKPTGFANQADTAVTSRSGDYRNPSAISVGPGAQWQDAAENTSAAGDFFKDPLPKADLITMGMILHDWNLEKKMHLIRSAYDALPLGGALVAIEALIDDARRENVQGLLMSLNMLIEFGDAFDYSGADFRKWCGEIGFKRFEIIHLAGASSAAVAYK
jgi:hypothetical protein